MHICFAGFCKYSYAKTERYSFDVFLWGIKVGELVYSIKKASYEYDISGVLRSKGFARVVTKYKFEAQTQGKVSNSKYSPWVRRQTAL